MRTALFLSLTLAFVTAQESTQPQPTEAPAIVFTKLCFDQEDAEVLESTGTICAFAVRFQLANKNCAELVKEALPEGFVAFGEPDVSPVAFEELTSQLTAPVRGGKYCFIAQAEELTRIRGF
ncbi:unnamed protein product [Bursaphelenchus xylophilus]|uniref:(pine wood nematode) hypothetical protein n=1 Tax=Bursaphelenchus xylophilus TaxID=6326 RepID=A0A1I7SUY7_BURXY|nr:unnamed protein product [Bursaphelenchus xylophilus]CAG9100619.1 unnamed protein product [Bursaphelenchus xylophilus]